MISINTDAVQSQSNYAPKPKVEGIFPATLIAVNPTLEELQELGINRKQEPIYFDPTVKYQNHETEGIQRVTFYFEVIVNSSTVKGYTGEEYVIHPSLTINIKEENRPLSSNNTRQYRNNASSFIWLTEEQRESKTSPNPAYPFRFDQYTQPARIGEEPLMTALKGIIGIPSSFYPQSEGEGFRCDDMYNVDQEDNIIYQLREMLNIEHPAFFNEEKGTDANGVETVKVTPKQFYLMLGITETGYYKVFHKFSIYNPINMQGKLNERSVFASALNPTTFDGNKFAGKCASYSPTGIARMHEVQPANDGSSDDDVTEEDSNWD